MSKKILNEQSIINELKGNSLFFEQSSSAPQDAIKHVARPSVVDAKPMDVLKDTYHTAPGSENVSLERRGISIKKESSRDSKLASYQANVINEIRKSVKVLGREVSFVRLTAEEKNQVVDVVYTYRRQGVKTSENEIHRIAVNLLLSDFKANGKSSILAKVIEALLA